LRAVAPQIEAWIQSIDAVLTRYPPAIETQFDPVKWLANSQPNQIVE
jgi:hypothetical protein